MIGTGRGDGFSCSPAICHCERAFFAIEAISSPVGRWLRFAPHHIILYAGITSSNAALRRYDESRHTLTNASLSYPGTLLVSGCYFFALSPIVFLFLAIMLTILSRYVFPSLENNLPLLGIFWTTRPSNADPQHMN